MLWLLLLLWSFAAPQVAFKCLLGFPVRFRSFSSQMKHTERHLWIYSMLWSTRAGQLSALGAILSASLWESPRYDCRVPLVAPTLSGRPSWPRAHTHLPHPMAFSLFCLPLFLFFFSLSLPACELGGKVCTTKAGVLTPWGKQVLGYCI